MDRALRVGIDFVPLRSRLTGVGNYELHLVQALLNNPRSPELVAFEWTWKPLGVYHDGLQGTVSRHERRARTADLLRAFGLNGALGYIAKEKLRSALYGLTAPLQRLSLFHAFSYVPPGRSSVPVIPVVYDLSFIRYPESHPTLRLRALKPLAQVLQSAPAIHTISNFSAREISDVFGVAQSRVHVIFPGIASCFQTSQLVSPKLLQGYQLSENSYFLVVSTLEPRKNLRTLVSAFGKLPQSIRERFPLCVVGPTGWGDLELPTISDSLIREGTLRFLGYVPNDDLANLYRAAAAFLYPSIYEGFGMPIVEALACGAPVICSGVGAMVEAAADLAHTLDPFDVEAWAQEMQKVVECGMKRGPTERERQHLIEKFSWERAAQQTLAMYAAAAT